MLPHLLRADWLEALDDEALSTFITTHGLRHLFQNYASASRAALRHEQPFNGAPLSGGASGVGYMWSDFMVHDEQTPLAYSRGRGFAFGKPLAQFLLQRAGIAGVLRAHQHNNNPVTGPMLDELRAGAGHVDNWGGAGLVHTFLSGTECPGFEFHYDSFGLLSLEGLDPTAWSLDHCSHHVAPQIVQLPLSRSTKQALGEAALRAQGVDTATATNVWLANTAWGDSGSQQHQHQQISVVKQPHKGRLAHSHTCIPPTWRTSSYAGRSDAAFQCAQVAEPFTLKAV